MKFLQCNECKLIFPFGEACFHDDESWDHVTLHGSCSLIDFESTKEQEELYLKIRKQWIQDQKDECEEQISMALKILKDAQEKRRELERRFPTERHNYW